MSNVKTFFKTIFWTLVVVIVILGGLWGYMRFFDQDLAQKFSAVVYKADLTDCPVYETGDVCSISDTGSVADTSVSDMNALQLDLSRIEDKLDLILSSVETSDNQVNDMENPIKVDTTQEKSTDDLLQELIKRVDTLEKTK